MSAPKLSFGLKKAIKPVKARGAAFGLGDDEEPVPSTSTLPAQTNGRMKVSTTTLSRQQKAKQAADLALDSSVYEYDEVYDNMKEGGRLAELAKKADAGERKPKYISRLLETAEVRKRDRVRAEDKMVQREREMEGDEFADKDAFVTPGYLLQQEELRKNEEEEKRKDEQSAAKGGGMSSFFKKYLDTTSKAHDQAVAASLSKAPVLGPTFQVKREQTDVELAAEIAAKTGRKIEVNDDGIIIDKRETMVGGLNIIAKPKASGVVGGFAAPIAARVAPAPDSHASSATLPFMSAAERGKQSRERHSREVERQMVALDAKRKCDAEEALGEKVTKVARRNDSTKVEELKRKAEERRLQRAQDEAAAAAAAAATQGAGA